MAVVLVSVVRLSTVSRANERHFYMKWLSHPFDAVTTLMAWMFSDSIFHATLKRPRIEHVAPSGYSAIASAHRGGKEMRVVHFKSEPAAPDLGIMKNSVSESARIVRR